MRNFYFFIFLILCVNPLTAQQNYKTEQIIWNGETYPYRYHHMEQYFRYYPNKRPVASIDSTIINRNYLAIFEVIENQFYLKDFLIKGNNSELMNQSVLHKINNKKEPILLNWVNGLFDIGIGSETFLKTDSINPVYDQYIVFEVKRGVIGRTELFTYNQMKLFKDYQYKRFKSTTDYDRLHSRLVYNGMTVNEANYHIYQFILFYSRSNFFR